MMKKMRTNSKRLKNICGGKLRPPVDCTNQKEMISVGLHPPFIDINRSIFTKTIAEKEQLKKVKNSYRPKRTIKLSRPMMQESVDVTIYVENPKKDKHFKTTRTMKFKSSEFDKLLNKELIRDVHRKV